MKTIRAGIWVGISNSLTSVLSFVRSIVLARLLTPEIFGIWAICMMVIRGIDFFTETGFGAALIQRQKSFEEAKDTAFTLMVIRGVVLTLLAYFLAPVISEFYEKEILELVIAFLAIAFFVSGFRNINIVYYEKELNFRLLTYLDQAQILFDFILVVSLAYYFRSVWALTIGYVVSACLSILFSYLIIPGKPRFSFNKKIALELFTYGKYITGLTIIIFLTTEIDNAVIGKVLGTEALGFYVLAYTLANIPATHFSKILSRILFPAYSKMQGDSNALSMALKRAIKFVALFTIPVTAMLFALSNELIIVIYGERWLAASNVLAILSIFGFFRGISSINGYMYNAIGKPNISFYLNTAKLVIICILIIPITKQFGIEGAALTVTVPLVLQFFVSLYILASILNTSFLFVLRGVLVPSISGIVLIVSFLLLSETYSLTNLVSLFSALALGLVFYFLLCFREIREFVALLR